VDDFEISVLLGENLMKHTLALTILSTAVLQGASLQTSIPEKREITPSAAPKVDNWAGFYFSGEFIYWVPKQDALDYAISGRLPVGSATPVPRGKVEGMNSNFQPGFKVGAGLNFRHDGWDIYGNYTWLNPADHRVSASESNPLRAMHNNWLFPTALTIGTLSIDQASEKWRLHFNAVDFELGRRFWISSWLALRPHAGFKAGWVKQDLDVFYHMINSAPLETVQMRFRQDYTGFGIRGGLHSFWKFAKEWGIIANLAVSELWSKFTSTREDISTTSIPSSGTSFNTESSFHTLRPVLEMQIGLQWSKEFRNGHQRLDIMACWEEQVWFNQNEFIDLTVDRYGDLNLQGLTAKFSYSF